MPRKKNIDSIDIKIINELSTNASISNKDLSKLIGLAQAPTLNRVNKLKEKGYLQGTSTSIDLKKFGYSLIAYQIFEIKTGFANQFKSIVAKLRNVTQLQRLQQLGYNNSENIKFGLTIHTKNTDELLNIMESNFETNSFVLNIETMIVKDQPINKNSIKLNVDIDSIK